MRDVRGILTREEIAELTRASDWRGAWSVLFTWTVIAATLALVALVPHPVTVMLALALLGGRQLALAVLMHECSHRALFRSRRLNDVAGRWLCAAPVWQRLEDYREHHMKHHSFTGTERDPDMGLVTPFPISASSLARKLLRDLLGFSGLKRVVALLAMDAGFITYTASTTAERVDQADRSWRDAVRGLWRHTGPTILFNGLLLALLVVLGHGWVFAVWIGAWLTTFSLFVRIRAMAEHACTDEGPDVFGNTRTVEASWLPRLFLCPHDVGFHLEHHLLMTVPHYKLRRMRRLLADRDALEGSHLMTSYLAVLRRVTA
jgi:fatty acid desaturase